MNILAGSYLWKFKITLSPVKNDLARNAETPELAALIVEKYVYGITKAARVMNLDTRDLYNRQDQLLFEIDPQVE